MKTEGSEKDTTRPALSRLLNPRSVAIAGISEKPGSLGATVLDNLARFGFAGDIHLIHPTRAELRGIRCVPAASDLPYGVDCVVLAIPAAAILDAVKGCAARGVGAVIIFSAGFAEAGAQGRATQEAIATIARQGHMVIEGPNCLGFVNHTDRVALTFAAVEPRPLGGPGVAVVSQSGAMAAVVQAALHSHDLAVTLSVSTGNEATHGIEDFVEYLLTSAATRAIALVVEHIRQPRRFLELVDKARARGIVVVMLHPGRSNAARQSAQTHTGALAGDYAVMRAVVEQYGVMVVDTLEELVDLSDCVMRCACRPYGGVAILSESGVYKALALDYCETLGLALPQPQGTAAEALNAIAPGLIVASNPLDLTAQTLIDPTLYARATESLMAHPQCGSLLVTVILSSAQSAVRKMPPVLDLLRHWSQSRTVLFAMLGEDTPIPTEIVAAVRASVPFFRSPERALRALARFTAWAESVPSQTAPPPIANTSRLHPGIHPEHAAKDILERAGLAVPRRRLVTDVDAALAAARHIGFPVALKIQSAALAHKTEVGGVILSLSDDDALRAGWARLHANVRAAAPNATIDGVLVEAMSGPGLELILGARNDSDWGPVLAVGLGGIFAEALADIRLIPAGLAPAAIKAALSKLKGAALLGSFRGRPARDLDAVAAAVAALGAFMLAHPEVREVDINPLIVFGETEGALALDALIACH